MAKRGKKPGITTIPATEARLHFGEMLKRVYRGGEQLIVEKDGLPVAAIMSHAQFEEYQRMQSQASALAAREAALS